MIGGSSSFCRREPQDKGAATMIKDFEKPERSTPAKWVLVMDDDDLIRFVMRAMLEQAGYKAYVTENGEEAIECFKEAKRCGYPFDAVILDLNVWGSRCGWDTFVALCEIDPGVKAVVMSGSSDDPAMTDYGSYGFKGALAKPFTSDDLEQVMRSVIDG
jgi:DNA-binding NtrC family response regulator